MAALDLRRKLFSYFRPIPPSLRIGLEINRGAYGTVHEGQLDGRPVAVKKIHRLLLEAASGERDTWERVVRDFEKECRLLEGLKHPHIVGFSGAFYDVQSEEPVLVMERMKENLRDLLGRERQLSLRRQLQICLEIAIGLEFLHSRSPPAVHRDLNDKNVMLSEEGVVKLGDLGQSRLKENSVDYFSTGQPGAVPFMPPEALSEHPHYTEKIDMFSLGVLMLEISTGRYPSVKLFGIGTKPEVVRRREDLSRLSDGHPLKPFILHCLKDDYKERPPAVIVRCFVESRLEVETTKEDFENTVKELETTKEKLSDTESRLESAVKELETTRQKLSDAENRLEGAVKVSKEDEDPELCGPMKSVQISDRESKMKLFEEEKLKLSHLYWREEPDVLERMGFPTAVYLNGKIFVGERWSGYHQFLCVFDVVSRTWSKLPFHDSCEMSGFTLATSNSKVHTLGGTWRKDGKVEEYSNKVFSLDDDLKWCNTLPPMNIGREHATSSSFDSFILVAGGRGRNGLLSSVEVLNSSQSSSTWWEICDLPVKSQLMQCTVTHDELFIGCGDDGTDNTVYTAKLSAVKESLNVDEDSESSVSPESFWQSLPQTPLRGSGLVSVNNCLLTVGGYEGLKLHSSVHLYDCYKKTWSKVSDIRKSRRFPAVVVSTFENKQELFVLGGWGADTSVESCELL